MALTISTQRPGIYTDYQVSGVLSSNRTSIKTVAVAAKAAKGVTGEPQTVTSYAHALELFGESSITGLIKTLMQNGAVNIVAVGLSSGVPDYSAAFDVLAKMPNVRVMVCDSTEGAVLAALKNAIELRDGNSGCKIAVAEAEGTTAQAIALANSINSERVMLTVHTPQTPAGQTAAAIAGAVAAQSDPALPLNAARLIGVEGDAGIYSDAEVTSLILGGVTPVETVGGITSVVRGVSTRTMTDTQQDATWREINTVLIADDVMLSVYEAVKSLFYRAKNNAQTRGAIRTQVVVELERKVSRQIIDSYQNVSVTVNADDPTVCDVYFEFAVTHGLNRINLSAFITV
ncbi:MAG: phage tail sheath protein [Oscillospiraceae bacterium]|nr:phage tail sheath protein [Oscillospiraceae bacterium]